jgi:hypothetical protein
LVEERMLAQKKLASLKSLAENKNDEDYDSESDLSIYESIHYENVSILTKIERLYNAFKSQTLQHDRHHWHEFPLLSIVETEPHSMTIMLKPKELKPDTMVKLLTTFE